MSLATEIQTAKTKATEQWAEVVHAAAAGNEPSLPAITKLATGLGITVPEAAAKLRADVDVVHQHNRATFDLAAADAAIADELRPYGGSDEDYRRAVEDAEAIALQLRNAYQGYSQGLCFTKGLAAGNIRRLEATRADLFNGNK